MLICLLSRDHILSPPSFMSCSNIPQKEFPFLSHVIQSSCPRWETITSSSCQGNLYLFLLPGLSCFSLSCFSTLSLLLSTLLFALPCNQTLTTTAFNRKIKRSTWALPAFSMISFLCSLVTVGLPPSPIFRCSFASRRWNCSMWLGWILNGSY